MNRDNVGQPDRLTPNTPLRLADGKIWDQIAVFVGHLDQRTTRR
jgi:hypothetical protein